MPREFTYQSSPMRVAFGVGYVERLGGEIAHLGLERVLVLSTPGQRSVAERASLLLGGRSVGVYSEATMHVPAAVARAAGRVAADRLADGCLAIGGGSTVGLGKAIALERGVPIVAVPTTYAGSEMTSVWGITENGVKRTGRDPVVLPRSVIYDPGLTVGVPPDVSVASGLNAVAHAVEALYAPDASPIVSLMAVEGARALYGALPEVARDGRDLDARSAALYGAWLCGAALGATTMSLHHQLCHILGGSFGLPHAETHAVVLPHVLAFNAPSALAATVALRRAFDSDDPAIALWDLEGRLGVTRSLAALGFSESDVSTVVERAVREPYANPRTVDAESLTALLTAAVRGERPPSDPDA